MRLADADETLGVYAPYPLYPTASGSEPLGDLRVANLADPPITRRLVTAYRALRLLTPSGAAVHNRLADVIAQVSLRTEQLLTSLQKPNKPLLPRAAVLGSRKTAATVHG
jgi:hypothetical protein